MTTLLLSARYTPDSITLWQAALAEGWRVRRLQGWRVAEIPDGPLCLYGEPLFATAIAEQVSLALLAPPLDWLPHLPSEYRQRSVRFATLAALHKIPFPAFVKPADDKCFVAKVYHEASALPDNQTLPADTPILIAEPVTWEREFRCFVRHRRLMTLSPLRTAGGILRERAPCGTGRGPRLRGAGAGGRARAAPPRHGAGCRHNSGARLGGGGSQPRLGVGHLWLRAAPSTPHIG